MTPNEAEELHIERMNREGDPRRCPRHPEVTTSSPDGLFDAPCGLCEAAMEAGIDTSEIPELGPDFFENAVLKAPGEDLIDEEPHDAPANDMKGKIEF